MLRRLGESGYRCESPSASLDLSIELPSIDYSRDDTLSLSTLGMEINDEGISTLTPPREPERRPVAQREDVALLLTNICKKLDTIVKLTSDFTTDVLGLREKADDLLDELRNEVLPYLIHLDSDMKHVESVIRYNIDRSNINEDRIDWLLMYNKYQLEMRRLFGELSGNVYEDLENSLELRLRGILCRRPSPSTVDNLAEMRRGMQRAVEIICRPRAAA